jgi:uncharacterized protein involved in exopolysaccharide biosynthesis
VNADQPIAVFGRDGIDVVAAIRVVWRSRVLVALIAAVFAIASVALALTAKKLYRATVTVTEVSQNPLGGGNSILGRLGGLASIAGVNLGEASGSYAQGVLTSRYLVQEFITDEHLLPVLAKGQGKRASLWFAVRQFQETVLKIHHDSQKNVTTISVDWTDPGTAAQWANAFVAYANQVIRTHEETDASRSVAYLNGIIGRTQSVEIRKSLYGLLEEQTKTLMLANARTDYPFQIIDPAVPPGIRYSPKRTLWVLSGTFAGFMLGAIVAFARNAYRRSKVRP